MYWLSECLKCVVRWKENVDTAVVLYDETGKKLPDPAIGELYVYGFVCYVDC